MDPKKALFLEALKNAGGKPPKDKNKPAKGKPKGKKPVPKSKE